MRRWIEWWDAYWFPSTSTRPLALSRIIAVAAQLFWFFPSLDYHVNFLEKNSAFINPQLLIRAIAAVIPRDVFFTPSTFGALYWVTAVAGVTALVGLFTRTSLFVFALGNWVLVAHAYSYGDRHHPEALFAMFLMALAFAPSGASFSVDALLRRRGSPARPAGSSERVETAMWPLKFIHVMLCLTYFSTGISKLIRGGLEWMNGYTLQGYVFADALTKDLPLGMWIGQQHTLAVLLSVATIIFEVFYPISLVLPWTAPFWFLGAILFHLGLYFTAGHPFFQHITLNFLLLLFITPPWWRSWLEKPLHALESRRQRPAQARQAV